MQVAMMMKLGLITACRCFHHAEEQTYEELGINTLLQVNRSRAKVPKDEIE